MNSAPLTFDRLAYIDRLMSGASRSSRRGSMRPLSRPRCGTVSPRSPISRISGPTCAAKFGMSRSIYDTKFETLRSKIRDVEVKLEAKIETTVAGPRSIFFGGLS